jgi:hypothetical protein
MSAFAIVWHSDTGYPTLPGWTVAGAYVVGALFCVRAALVTRQAQQPNKLNPWWVLAILLLFLGINKLIALQSLLIGLGRAAARTEGWYQHRRVVQAVFVVLFTLALLTMLAACFKKWRCFLKEQPLVLAGFLLLSVFVVIRASGFNHVEELLHMNLQDDDWSWILELGGIACLAWPAARVKTR